MGIGIVIFFLYTMMRIMFKKPEDNEPHTKDFLLDAEQRKFIFAEDYCSTLSGLIPDITAKDCALIQERLEQKRRSRSKTPEVYNKEDLEPIPENAVTEEAVEEDIVEKTTAQPDTLEVPETLETPDISQAAPMEDDEVDQLRRRLEETERAMERIVAQMGNVSEKLMPIISTDASAHPDKAMVEEAGGNQAAASKGSSPDMEEYEVIATELKNPTAEVGSEIHPEQDAHITSTTAESECKDSTRNLKILKKLTTGNAHELNKWRDTFTNYENKNGFPFYVRLGDSCLRTLDPATVS